MKINSVIIEDAGVNTTGSRGIVDIFWEGEGEFGHIYLYFYGDGRIKIDSEYMGKEFVKQVLSKLVDDAELKE